MNLDAGRCQDCKGLLEPLSRQASQNAMGPWFIRDTANPFRPGCSWETLVRLAEKGRITRETVVRGPETRQFWKLAGSVPGLAAKLGACHACAAEVSPRAEACPGCGASFSVVTDRQFLGLSPVRLLPGQAPASAVAASAAAAPPWRPRPLVEEVAEEVDDWGTPPGRVASEPEISPEEHAVVCRALHTSRASGRVWASCAIVLLCGMAGAFGWAAVHQGRLWGGHKGAVGDGGAGLAAGTAVEAGGEGREKTVSPDAGSTGAAAAGSDDKGGERAKEGEPGEEESTLVHRAREAAQGGTRESFEAAIRLLEESAAGKPLTAEERSLLEAYRLSRRAMDAQGLP